jgi:F-box and leucine-rich repeat protein 2/20
MRDVELVVLNCQSVGKLAIEGVVNNMRPRKGWRTWEARLVFGRVKEDVKVGQDECDEKRVVINFDSW